MNKFERSSMVITYQRCNGDNDLYHLQDWKSNNADILWVALMLDNLPSKLMLRFSELSKQQIVLNANGTTRCFFAQVPKGCKYEFKDLTISPYLSETGLKELNVKLRLNWKTLSLRFEFPVEQSHLEVLKSNGRW